MNERSHLFAPYKKKRPADPHPSILTPEERAYIHHQIDSGCNVKPLVVLKLLRLYDEAIRELAVREQAGGSVSGESPRGQEEAPRVEPVVGTDGPVSLG